MMKTRLMMLWLLGLSVPGHAQEHVPASFLSRLFFPFEVGYAWPVAGWLQPGSLVQTGVEYRFTQPTGLFIRLNADNRTNRYALPANGTTNVTAGRLRFNDYMLGLGYRASRRRISFSGLVQVGLSAYCYPFVTGSPNQFSLHDRVRQTSLYKIELGAEYSIAPSAALTLATGYGLMPDPLVSWGHGFGTYYLSFGLTTTLF